MNELEEKVVPTPADDLPEEVTGEVEEKTIRTYTDEDVDRIVQKKKVKWGKKMEKDIQEAIEKATGPLTEKLNELQTQLETERTEKIELQTKAVLQKKINAVTEALNNEDVMDARLLTPHIDFDAVTIGEDGKVDLGSTIADIKGKFPSAFGTRTAGKGGIPAKSGQLEPVTDVQQANKHIAEGHNQQAIASLLKAGKFK